MVVRSLCTTWTTKLPPAFEELLDEGRQVELLAGEGLLILQRDPEAVLHVTWLPESESGYGLRASGPAATPQPTEP